MKEYTQDSDGKPIQRMRNTVDVKREKKLGMFEVTIPIEESNIFVPNIHDSVIITRTKKFEHIFYRILITMDDRLTLKDITDIINGNKGWKFTLYQEEIKVCEYRN